MSDPRFPRPKSLERLLKIAAIERPVEWVVIANYPTQRGAQVAATRYEPRALALGLTLGVTTDGCLHVRALDNHNEDDNNKGA